MTCQRRTKHGLCGLPARWRCIVCGDHVCTEHQAGHFKVEALTS